MARVKRWGAAGTAAARQECSLTRIQDECATREMQGLDRVSPYPVKIFSFAICSAAIGSDLEPDF